MYGLGCCSCGRRMFRPIDLAADVVGAAVGRLHDARPAAGDDHVLARTPDSGGMRRPAGRTRGRRRSSGSTGTTGSGPIDRPLPQPHRPARPASSCLRPRRAAAGRPPAPTICVLPNTTIVERMPFSRKYSSGLRQFQFDPRRAHLRPGQKIDVLVGHAIAGRLKGLREIDGGIVGHGGILLGASSRIVPHPDGETSSLKEPGAARILGREFWGRRPCGSPSPGHRPGEREAAGPSIGPTGQRFDERLARWADNVVLLHLCHPGRCPGLGEACSFGAIATSPANLAAPKEPAARRA